MSDRVHGVWIVPLYEPGTDGRLHRLVGYDLHCGWCGDTWPARPAKSGLNKGDWTDASLDAQTQQHMEECWGASRGS